MNKQFEKLSRLAVEVEEKLGGLSKEQLNWKPGPDIWSVGQCLDHLVVTNKQEIPAIKAGLAGEHNKTVWERLPLLSSVMGKFIVKSVDPSNKRKNNAPKTFQPSQSDIGTDIVKEYLKTSGEIQELIKQSERVPARRMIITSPVAKVATYSIHDALKIVVLHDQRHFNQAIRVMETEGFPA